MTRDPTPCYILRDRDGVVVLQDGRMKFHMHRRLKKALMYSGMLLKLCKATADERTCVEAEVMVSPGDD